MIGSFFAAFRIALRAIRRNVLRATLTVLGILIGVTSVVTVTALGGGVRDSVGSQIESLGSNFIIIFPQSAAVSGAKGAQGVGARLTEDDGRALKNESVSIAAVAPVLRARGQLVYADKNTSTSILGSTREFLTVRNWKLTRGEMWDEHDETGKTKVCVLGSTVLKNLFGDKDPVGETVRIGRYPYRVIGVLETKGEAPFGGDQDDIVLMPISSMRARVMKTSPGFAGVLMVSAKSADTTDRAAMQIDSILRQRHHIEDEREPDFAIRTQKEFQAMQQTIFGLLTILLVGVAAISLLVGGIGVMNIMLVSVTERTREIGIRMAIGARENDILTQFLVEAIVLAMIGGLAGAAIGAIIIAGLSAIIGIPLSLSSGALMVSLVVSGLTGVIFGFFPARRAAKLDPIEALRRE